MAGCTIRGVALALCKVLLVWTGRILQVFAITGASTAADAIAIYKQNMASAARGFEIKYCETDAVIRSIPILLAASLGLFAALILSNVFIGYRTHGWAGVVWALLAIEPLVYAWNGAAQQRDVMELAYSAAAAVAWNGGQAILALYTLLEVFASRCAADMSTLDVFHNYWKQILIVGGSFVIVGYHAAVLALYLTTRHSLAALDNPVEAYNASFGHTIFEAIVVELPLTVALACNATANGLAYTLLAVLTRRGKLLSAIVMGRLAVEWVLLTLFLGFCWHNVWKAAVSVVVTVPWAQNATNGSCRGLAWSRWLISLFITLGLGFALGGLVIEGYQVRTFVQSGVQYYFPADEGLGQILLGLALSSVVFLPLGMGCRYCCAIPSSGANGGVPNGGGVYSPHNGFVYGGANNGAHLGPCPAHYAGGASGGGVGGPEFVAIGLSSMAGYWAPAPVQRR